MRFMINTITGSAIVLTALAGLSMPLLAEEAASIRATRSISYTADAELDQETRKTRLDNAELAVMDVLLKEGYRPESTAVGALVENTSYHTGGDITIYDASTTLISDFDDDGFYHRFSVAIDADTIYSTSWVYAELYLSYEGGPWNYYASSEDFHIHADSELDIQVVETELAEGFPAGYYDIRIELYDAEYGDLLHSYGPYDDGSLSSLPLEDSVYDDLYSTGYTTEVIVAGHGGLGLLFIAAFSLAGLLRRTGGRYEQ